MSESGRLSEPLGAVPSGADLSKGGGKSGAESAATARFRTADKWPSRREGAYNSPASRLGRKLADRASIHLVADSTR